MAFAESNVEFFWGVFEVNLFGDAFKSVFLQQGGEFSLCLRHKYVKTIFFDGLGFCGGEVAGNVKELVGRFCHRGPF